MSEETSRLLCAKFQVDTVENDIFRAFQRPKMATFQDILMHYQAFVFLFLHVGNFFHALNSVIGKVIFLSQDDKTTQKHVGIMKLNDPNHKINLVT